MCVSKTDFDGLQEVYDRPLRFSHNDFLSDDILLLDQPNGTSFSLVSMRSQALVKCLNAWMG